MRSGACGKDKVRQGVETFKARVKEDRRRKKTANTAVTKSGAGFLSHC